MQMGSGSQAILPPVQVVFQGGGARFCTLMVICDVLKERHDKDIEIKRVAGSSAGAVAAVMLASKRSMSDYIKLTQEIGNKILPRLRPTLGGFWRVVRGRPFFDNVNLENLFRELFCEGKDAPQLIGDLNFTPRIYFTNLYSLASQTCDLKDPIPEAVAKSCRCPFALAGFKDRNNHVDGGLAMNLPVDELKLDVSTMGNVIGISFANKFTNQAPSLVSYAGQIISAAIQSGVVRSEMALGKNNVYSIHTDIETFDFERALKDGLVKDYEQEKSALELGLISG
jgi:predicted acylesterase/phospholipase RssA